MSLYQLLIWPFGGSMSTGNATMLAAALVVAGILVGTALCRYVLPKDPYGP